MFSERRIFQHGERFYDPVAVYRRLMVATRGQLSALLEQYQGGEFDGGALMAACELGGAAVVAFELMPFDPTTGQGTLQDESLDLLSAFLNWREEKKTPAGNSPISAPPTARAGSRPPTASPSITRPTMVSPSMRNASGSKTPSPLQGA